jgi:phenolic acid decarboxylase
LQKVADEIEKWKESNQAYKEIIEEKEAEIKKLKESKENNEDRVNMEYYKKLYEDTERELNDIKFRKK